MFELFWNARDMFLDGFIHTILASIFALVGSLIIGTLMATMQTSHQKIVKGFAQAYVEFFRNIPLVVIVMFCYIVLPMLGLDLDGFTAGTIGLAVYTSAFISDIIRTGLQAIPKGQTEAARSTGLTSQQTMMYIILPQAIKVVIPPLGNRFVSMIKDSAILAMVAGFDLMYQADLLASSTFETFKVYSIVALCYLVLTLPMSRLMVLLEKKWSID